MKLYNLPEINITREQMPFAIAGGVAIAAILAYVILYAPLMKDLKTRSSEYASESNRLNDALADIRSAGKDADGIVLMTEKDMPRMIEELTQYGKDLGVTFQSMKPGEVIKQADHHYSILPIDMEIEAKDKQCAAFLGLLDSLKKTLIRLRSFDISPDRTDRTRLNARIVVDLYFASA